VARIENAAVTEVAGTRHRTPVEMAVRIGVLVLWATWCFRIMQPFFPLLVWGIVLAVAVNPIHKMVVRWLGGRTKLAAILLTAVMLVAIIGPVVGFSMVLVENLRSLASDLADEKIVVPLPPPEIESWPIIGEQLYDFWHRACYSLESALAPLGAEIRALGTWAVNIAAGTGLGILEFAASIIVAGLLLVHSKAGHRLSRHIGRRLGGDQGGELADVAEATLRGVARGVMAVALIQSFLAGAGMMLAGVPYAGIWTLVALIMAVVQIGVGPVVIPAIFYVFSTQTTGVAIAFLVWSIFVMLIDNVLRPLLMGRGVNVPMAVIFLGAIGGMLLSGIVGLFVGAMILALGHRLFITWLNADEEVMPPEGNPPATVAAAGEGGQGPPTG